MKQFSVVLVQPRYDGNIGSVARAMANFGFDDLILVDPPEIGKEGRRNSMHAKPILDSARVFESFEQAIADLDFLIGTTAKVAGDGNILRTPIFADQLENAITSDGKIGLLFGREDFGLLNDELARCDVLVTIPASHEYPTLNLAMSVAVLLYELTNTALKAKATQKKFRQLSGIEKDVLLRFYDEAADELYSHGYECGLAKKTFRQLIGRAFISGREAKTLTGMFRRAAETLQGKRDSPQ